MISMEDRVAKMLKEHLSIRGPTVVQYTPEGQDPTVDQQIYIIKSLSRPNQTYSVVKESSKFSCDCPSFKYQTGTTAGGACKHIILVEIILSQNFKLEKI